MAKHFSEKERQQIIAQLCEIGHAEFTMRGLRAARIEDICRTAGISKGSFYSFFQSKEQLFLAVIEQREQIHHTTINELVENFEGSEASLVAQLFETLVGAIETDPFISVMMQPGEMEHLVRKVGPEQMAAHQNGDFEFFANLTHQIQAKGFCQHAPKDTIAEIAVLVFCLTMQRHVLPMETLKISMAHLKDLLHFKLSSKGTNSHAQR